VTRQASSEFEASSSGSSDIAISEPDEGSYDRDAPKNANQRRSASEDPEESTLEDSESEVLRRGSSRGAGGRHVKERSARVVKAPAPPVVRNILDFDTIKNGPLVSRALLWPDYLRGCGVCAPSTMLSANVVQLFL
jgi:hypothetical protein